MEDRFSRNSVDLSTQEGSTIDNQSSTYVDKSKEDTGGIGGFFASLFGMDDDDETRRRRDNYTTVAARHSVVTVHTVDAEEAERAADILDDAGAIDVDERAEQYRGGTHASYNTPVADSLTSAPSGSTGAAMFGDDMTRIQKIG